jgi:hypothetical protein
MQPHFINQLIEKFAEEVKEKKENRKFRNTKFEFFGPDDIVQQINHKL